MASQDHPRHEVSGNHPPRAGGHRHTHAKATCGGIAAFRWLHGGLALLQSLAGLFPQHGPGKKHLRPIRLEHWQEVLVKQATEEFVRGLIDSDGCRVVANDRGVRSVRYHFSNRSDDIRDLFCAALDALDIPRTRPSKYQVAIYRKAATARLDEFVGPKA